MAYLSYDENRYTPTTTKAPAKTTTTKSSYSTSTALLQQQLKAAGYNPGSIDGIMGPKTKAALNAYNAAQNKTAAPKGDTYNPQTATLTSPTGETATKVINNNGVWSNAATGEQYPNLKAATGNGAQTNPNNLSYQPPVQEDPYKAKYEQLMQSMNSFYNPQAYYDKTMAQFENSKQSNIADLRAAYDKARSDLNSQMPTIQQNTQNALNANDSYYYGQALPQLRAAMEAAGNYGGGEMLGQNVNLISMRGQNASDINQQGTNQLQQLQNAVSQLNAEQPLKEASLSASSDANALAAALQAANQGIQNQLGLAGLTGNINGQSTMQQQQFNADQAYRSWSQKMAEDEAAWSRSSNNPSVAAQILSNEAATINLQYLPDQLKAELQQIQQNIANGRLTTQSQLEETRARIKQIGESTAQGWAQITGIYTDSKGNVQNTAETNRINYSISQDKINSYKAQIDQKYVTPNYDGLGRVTGYQYNYGGPQKTDGIYNYIQVLNQNGALTDAEAKQLLSIYGFTGF